ncbi:MAG TPA: ferrous iron transport protein B [candidate division Zixibacteria bacterium]|nr:ferrous iron transport protein B [candidate division Zixibacteria bacterium]
MKSNSVSGRKIRIALTGNPNSGKTTVFNAITGSHQHVGNYPGVTVEKKIGSRRFEGNNLEIVDLPGVYSLTPHSAEEVVARNYLIEEKPDVVIDIIDSSSLERNLYLAIQLLEMGVPLVLAFNMSDVAVSRGIRIDIEKLSRLLNVPIVPTVGSRSRGIDELLQTSVNTAGNTNGTRGLVIGYGPEIDAELDGLRQLISADNGAAPGRRRRWLALKTLEGDREIEKLAEWKDVFNTPDLRDTVENAASRLASSLEDSPEVHMAESRYAYISDIVRETVSSAVEQKRNMSDRIDSIVTNRVLGLPIFLGLMYVVFQLTFTVGEPLMGWIENLFGWLGGLIESNWPSDSALKSLIEDGIIGGVGGVLVFLPNILLLFLAIAVLEDSGYMARAAFIMDRLMHKIGLQGKSFIPLLIGFGCTIPAIMATRTLENQRDRLTTMLVAPLMSCGARLPIYTLLIPAFFPRPWHGIMLWTIYAIGIVLAIVIAKLLRSTALKGESAPFVMELPPYRMPTPKSVLLHMWERGRLYLRKAGTVILAISIILWALTTYPQKTVFDKDYDAAIDRIQLNYNAELVSSDLNEDAVQAFLDKQLAAVKREQQAEAMAYTAAGRIGHWIEPLIKPMGFDWKIGTALIGAFAAKEVFVAQMGIVYAIGEEAEEADALRQRLQASYTPLVAFCIMLFCLVSAPCMATIVVTGRESNSWKWALLQLGGLTMVAWILATAVYQIGSIL